MNRHLLTASTLHEFSSESFARRSSLTSGLNLGHSKKRPKIEIHLDNQPSGFHVPSYTTRERIHGHVTINSAVDNAFDDIHISFQGTSRTWVEKIATAAPTNPRTRAFHTFLRLMQPIEEADVPEQHMLRAGRSYNIPFEFVVPERLLPQSCSHSRQNPQVEEEHLKLPPSLGDVMVSGDGKTLHPDFAPEMTTITYSVRVVITRKNEGTQARPVIIGDNQLKLRIIPRADEVPPLDIINDPGEDYITKKCKSIKKGLLMGKTKVGTLRVKTAQPPPLRLPNVRSAKENESASVMTMVTLKMRFDPAKAAVKPPKLQMLWSRLKIATFFSTAPQKNLPNKSAAYSLDQNRGLMVDTLPLSSRNLGGQGWTKHISERRDSAVAFPFVDPPSSPEEELAESPLREQATRSVSPSPATTPTSEDGPCTVYYTADVLVPVELPYSKFAFVPTFHSCLVSRVYALDMNLGVTSGPGNSHSIHLKVPVQITSVGSDSPVSSEGMTPEGGFASARQELQDVFAPNMAVERDAPPDFDNVLALGGRRNTSELGHLGQSFHGDHLQSDNEDGSRYDLQRPTWSTVSFTGRHGQTHRISEFSRDDLDNGASRLDNALPRTASPTSRIVGARSPSPRTTRITNDEILNTEDYEDSNAAEQQFGNFRWEPIDFTVPGGGANHGTGEQRRASEGLPPGYASVAAGTMLIGSGGMVRALS